MSHDALETRTGSGCGRGSGISGSLASDALGPCGQAEQFGRMERVRDDLGAAQACGFAFLLPPAAVRAEVARCQAIHDRRQELDDPRGEAAVCAVEMPAAMACTRRPEAEDRRRRDRAGEDEHFLRGRTRIGEVGQTRLLRRPPDHSQDGAALQVRWGARATGRPR
jgi:hypothetical protein